MFETFSSSHTTVMSVTYTSFSSFLALLFKHGPVRGARMGSTNYFQNQH